MKIGKMGVGLILVAVVGVAWLFYDKIREERLEPETLSALFFPMKSGELRIMGQKSRENRFWLECYYFADDHEKTAADTLWGRGLVKLSLYQGLAFMDEAREGATDLVWDVSERMRLESVGPGALSLYIDDALVDVSKEENETRMLLNSSMIKSAIDALDDEARK